MDRKSYLCIFIICLLFPVQRTFHHYPDRLIIWSVGQGQMVTYSDVHLCVHFDMGGEKFPLRKLLQECGKKKNKVFFSHWDWDHINFVRKAWRRLPFFCRLNEPGGVGNKKKKAFLLSVPLCEIAPSDVFKEIFFKPHLNRSHRVTDSNKYSRVIIVKRQVLIPGDSPGSSEHLWEKKITDPIRILIVSHHGSRFSTTPQLLNRLPYLKMAVASARKKRYGHPHIKVRKRLARKGIPLLSTDDYGNIIIPLYSR